MPSFWLHTFRVTSSCGIDFVMSVFFGIRRQVSLFSSAINQTFFIVDSLEKFLSNSQLLLIVSHNFRIVVEFRKPSLEFLSYRACKISGSMRMFPWLLFNLFDLTPPTNRLAAMSSFFVVFLKNYFIVIQVQLSTFTAHHSLPHPSHPHLPPLIPLPLGFVHVSFIVVPEIPSPLSPHYPLPPALWLLSDCS